MITAYHRPQTLAQTLELLTRPAPRTLPLGGGTFLSQGMPESVDVVDLHDLNLNYIRPRGKDIEIGATTTLQQLLESESSSPALLKALKLEAPLNIRNAATIAGTIVACDGRSSFTTAMLALDSKLTGIDLISPGTVQNSVMVSLGDFLPLRKAFLITQITLPSAVRFGFEYVSRTPVDKPIVCVALAVWPSGRARLAVGGFGDSPILAMDGPEIGGLESAARNAYHEAADDWAGADFRMDIGARLVKRCFDQIGGYT